MDDLTVTPPLIPSGASPRARLIEAVAQLADAIARGDCIPERIELYALAQVCDEHDLPIEAARVRRWLRAAA